jgi:hypothetical protein
MPALQKIKKTATKPTKRLPRRHLRRPAASAPSPAATTPRKIRLAFGVSRRTMSRLSGFSERAIAGWEAGKRQSRTSQQRMSELHRLRAALARVMSPTAIATWLDAPNDKFSGLKPLEVVERGEIDRLWQMIYYLESGMPG